MKRLILTLTIVLLYLPIWAQLINAPESVIFDEVRNRYYVSNSPRGEIICIDSVGRQSYFVQLAEGTSEGLYISGDTLWEAASTPNRIIAYDLNTGDSLLAITDTLDGNFFDSIALDTSGNAYVAVSIGYSNQDAGWIFKCRLSDSSWSIFADEGIRFPQAMRFIPEDNSLIVSSAAINPSIIAKINIADSSVTQLLNTTFAFIMDGITFDVFGNTYLSSWFHNAVFRYGTDYTDPPELIMDDFDGPTSLYYNKQDNVLAIPDIAHNRVVFIEMYATIDTDINMGWPPFEVNFTGNSELEVENWNWDFDDGQTSDIQSPTHIFIEPGLKTVNLEVESGGQSLNRRKYIAVLGDTLFPGDIIVSSESMIEIDIYANNTIPLNDFFIPIEYSGPLDLQFDSASTMGCRTEYFDTVKSMYGNQSNKEISFRIWNNIATTPDLEPGYGLVLRTYFTVPALMSPGQMQIYVDGFVYGFIDRVPQFGSPFIEDKFSPLPKVGTITKYECGDADFNDYVDILDIVYIINHLYNSGPGPEVGELADVNHDTLINILDAVYLLNFKYKNGIAPLCPQIK